MTGRDLTGRSGYDQAMSDPYSYSVLAPGDVALMRLCNRAFADAFEEPEQYLSNPPDDAYLAAFLAKPHVVVIVAMQRGSVIGGLVAYALEKFEQACTEFYIYDLAVTEPHRRRGVAKALINRLRDVARARGAEIAFVQADAEDEPAVALYENFSSRREVFHFDIPLGRR